MQEATTTSQPLMAQHGTSVFMQPQNPKLLAEAEFEDWSPASCVCMASTVSDAQKARTYARVYENKLEVNYPSSPFYCFTEEVCIVDKIEVMYFDKPPARIGMCCGLIPFTCCGPPVIFSSSPKCCCFDLTPYYGQQIRAAPADMFGLKTWLVCGEPCYKSSSTRLLRGVKNGGTFIAKLKQAVDAYAEQHNIPTEQRAIFQDVEDNAFDFLGSASNTSSTNPMAQPTSAQMDRNGEPKTSI